jgi:hypothetical protein
MKRRVLPKAEFLSAGDTSPKIGIFWLCKDNAGKVRVFRSYPKPVNQGRIQEHIIYASDDHKNFWDTVLVGFYPDGMSYSFLPRGKVYFNSRTREYVMVAGKWAELESSVQSVVCSEFCVSSVVYEHDAPYDNFESWIVD